MDWVRSLLGLLSFLFALGALGGSLIAQGGRLSAQLDVLTHLVPLYLVFAGIGAGLAFAAPRGARTGLLLLSVVALLAAGALIAPEILRRPRVEPQAVRAPGQLKVIQFNAWGQNAKAAEAVAWILRQEADVVVVQEAGRVRDPLLSAGYHASCLSCGAVVFSRVEPVGRYAEPKREGGQRSLLSSSTLRTQAGVFSVVGIHRHWPVRFAKEASQTEDLRAYLATLPKGRLILAGDFNSTPWSFARQREDREFGLLRRTIMLPTWPAETVSHNRLPAPFPYMPIDHVYAGPGWTTVSVELGPRLGSDHYPVVVTLTPSPPVADPPT